MAGRGNRISTAMQRSENNLKTIELSDRLGVVDKVREHRAIPFVPPFQSTAGSGKGELIRACQETHHPHHHQVPEIDKCPQQQHGDKHNNGGIRKLPEFFKTGFFWIPWPGRFM